MNNGDDKIVIFPVKIRQHSQPPKPDTGPHNHGLAEFLIDIAAEITSGQTGVIGEFAIVMSDGMGGVTVTAAHPCRTGDATADCLSSIELLARGAAHVSMAIRHPKNDRLFSDRPKTED